MNKPRGKVAPSDIVHCEEVSGVFMFTLKPLAVAPGMILRLAYEQLCEVRRIVDNAIRLYRQKQWKVA